ncbi:protein LEO1 [Sesamum angolense]|uniref:Protein LEO1 n=1 Tax=Sesamum angolense TaxID=2727404 RepID=A0AAE1T4A2_9LAMI|nr:protein LEO1 [Sesamum angolense]
MWSSSVRMKAKEGQKSTEEASSKVIILIILEAQGFQLSFTQKPTLVFATIKTDAMVRSQNPVSCRNYKPPELFIDLKVMLMGNEDGEGRLENEKSKNPALSSATVIHEVFRDTGDGEPEDYATHDCINEKNKSPKYKKNYPDESPVENEDEISKVQKENVLRESEEEGTKTELKDKEVVPPAGSPPIAAEIPLRFPSHRLDQMATINLSSIIGIDPNQFDPATYVEEDFYVTDASGVSRLIPPTNIIRWREVRNPDGTTSVESNARFVTWLDGSLQLLIGNEAFCISEQDAQGIKSYLFLRDEKGPKDIEKSTSLPHYSPEDENGEGYATHRKAEEMLTKIRRTL